MTGTRTAGTMENLPEGMVKRIRAIEAKPRPRSRPWKGVEAEKLMNRPGFERAHRASMEMAASHHAQWAERMGLDRTERTEFLSILRESHEARLEALAYRLKQGSGYPGRIRELAEAQKLPAAVVRSDPRVTHRRLRQLLGEKRYARFLVIGETAGGKRGSAR